MKDDADMSKDIIDEESEQKTIQLQIPTFSKVEMNDWFDPLFTQARIQMLKRFNMIDSEEATQKDVSNSDIISSRRE